MFLMACSSNCSFLNYLLKTLKKSSWTLCQNFDDLENIETVTLWKFKHVLLFTQEDEIGG